MSKYIIELSDVNDELAGVKNSIFYTVEVAETTAENEKEAVFLTLKEYAEVAYEQESARENSIKTQASNMQAAFSFVTAAVVASMPFIYQQKGTLSDLFLFLAFSSILIALGLSLCFATFALKLMKGDGCDLVLEQKQYFSDNYKNLKATSNRLDYWLKLYDKWQTAKRKNTENRIKWLNGSRYAFITALGLCAFWYVTAFITMVTM